MNSTSFGFNGQFFSQFPISPIVSDFVMTDLEDNCLNKLSFKPIFYKRYVDDIIIGIFSILKLYERVKISFLIGVSSLRLL